MIVVADDVVDKAAVDVEEALVVVAMTLAFAFDCVVDVVLGNEIVAYMCSLIDEKAEKPLKGKWTMVQQEE